MGFIMALNDSVVGKSLSDKCTVSPATTSVLGLLDVLSTWVDEIPPVEQPQRFGNKAFRDYYARVKDRTRALVGHFVSTLSLRPVASLVIHQSEISLSHLNKN
jgi:hypothetical protein